VCRAVLLSRSGGQRMEARQRASAPKHVTPGETAVQAHVGTACRHTRLACWLQCGWSDVAQPGVAVALSPPSVSGCGEGSAWCLSREQLLQQGTLQPGQHVADLRTRRETCPGERTRQEGHVHGARCCSHSRLTMQCNRTMTWHLNKLWSHTGTSATSSKTHTLTREKAQQQNSMGR